MNTSLGNRSTISSTRGSRMVDDGVKEHVWGVTLKEGEAEHAWEPQNDCDSPDKENSTSDHTLHIKGATIGAGAKEGEDNIVEITALGYGQELLKLPAIHLVRPTSLSMALDLFLGRNVSVTLKLVEGHGPVCVFGQRLEELVLLDEESDEESEEEDEEEMVVERPKKLGSNDSRQMLKTRKKKTAMKRNDLDEEMSEEDSEEDMDYTPSKKTKAKKEPAPKVQKKIKVEDIDTFAKVQKKIKVEDIDTFAKAKKKGKK